MVAAFTCLIVLQLAIIVLHDLINIPGWVHGSQVQAAMGRQKVWLATLANSVFPGIAVGFAIRVSSPPTMYLLHSKAISRGVVVMPNPLQ